jgi:hypothetical protein
MTRTIMHTRGSEFLRVGLGNIDKVNLIDNGDIGHYPTYAYFSKAQSCKPFGVIEDQGHVLLEHSMMAPVRCPQDPICKQKKGKAGQMMFKRLFFETLINVPKHLDTDGNIVIRINHK